MHDFLIGLLRLLQMLWFIVIVSIFLLPWLFMILLVRVFNGEEMQKDVIEQTRRVLREATGILI